MRYRARIVINFDAHPDFPQVGAVDPATVRCDNWGLYTVRAVNDSQGIIYYPPFADVYVSVGVKGGANSWSTSFARLRPPAATQAQSLPGETATLQVQALVDLLMENSQRMIIGAWDGFDVYITVDRDIAQESYTDYNDGGYSTADVWRFVDEYVNALRSLRTPSSPVTFAGFDICGLPTWGGVSNIGGDISTIRRYAIAFNDILQFRNIIRGI